VLGQYRDADPAAARVGIADISRPGGGPFGPRYGGLGHASHQNGLDVDIYYPRSDRSEQSITAASQIDRGLARALIDRFVKAGVVYVFVGPNTGLKGKRGVVQRLVHHDDHMHVRFRPRAR
jgi:murein endopeptidase